MFGRMYNEVWGRTSAVLIFRGFNFNFFPQFLLGYMGMPRRYHVYPPEFQTLQVLSTAGASLLALGYGLPLIYLFHARSEKPTSELQSLMRISYAVFCLKKIN